MLCTKFAITNNAVIVAACFTDWAGNFAKVKCLGTIKKSFIILIPGYRAKDRSSDRLGGQSLAPAPEGASDRGHQLDRRHDVSQGPEVLPHERQELLDRLSHRSRWNLSLVRYPSYAKAEYTVLSKGQYQISSIEWYKV